jgi:hypothetical protein
LQQNQIIITMSSLAPSVKHLGKITNATNIINPYKVAKKPKIIKKQVLAREIPHSKFEYVHSHKRQQQNK